MSASLELLEQRTFFSTTTATIAADSKQVLSDLATLQADYKASLTSYHTDATELATALKTLSKNKTNSYDEAVLGKVQAVALAAEAKDIAALVTVEKTEVTRATKAFVQAAAKPTETNMNHLQAALAAAEETAMPYEAKLVQDAGTGISNVDLALNALVTANPNHPVLASTVTQIQQDAGDRAQTLENDLGAVENDINVLTTDL